MTKTILLTILIAAIIPTLQGCHYYIDAAPRVIISSQPFQTPKPFTHTLSPYNPNQAHATP